MASISFVYRNNVWGFHVKRLTLLCLFYERESHVHTLWESIPCPLVVYRSSETSTNQSDVIIRSDDRFFNLVVDSDSIVSKIYMLNFVLWLGFFMSPYWQKYCSFIPAGFFCPHTDKHLAILSKRTFDTHSIHIFGLVYYLSIYIRCYTYGKRSFVLFYFKVNVY